MRRRQLRNTLRESSMKTIFKLLTFTIFLLVFAFHVLARSFSFVYANDYGWKVDLTSQKGGVGLGVASTPFYLGERIILFAYVTYNEVPVQSVLVAFQVNNPQDSLLILSTAQTNSSGYAQTDFTITQNVYPHYPSLWNAFASTSPAQETVKDTMSFHMLSPVGGFSFSSQTQCYIRTFIAELSVTFTAVGTAKFLKFKKR